ncbi:MAG: ribosome maturation factor RimM [Cyanobacteria bacterium P01_C01_bin.89]
MEEWLSIGTVVGAQGLKGEVRVKPESEFPERFLEPGTRWILPVGAKVSQAEPQPVELLAGRANGKGTVYILKLAGTQTRTAAEGLQGATLYVPVGDRPPLEDGEFHYLDLLGLTVVDQSTQETVGTVVDLKTQAQDLLEIKLASGSRTVLIPFVDAIVPVVDLEQGRVEITPPPGLLDLG